MAGLTDTHCHLNLPHFQEDLDQVLQRAWDAGVDRILIPGIDVESSRLALKLAERDPRLFAAVGVHPHDAPGWQPDTLTMLRELTQHPKAAAIGEIGLDYHRDGAPRPLQKQVFQNQLELAAEVGLPVVVHNRDSREDVWTALSAWQAALAQAGHPLAERPGVLHSFEGELPFAQEAAASGFLIGISGPVTFKNAPERHQVAAGLQLSQILIETDAPYLTPHPFRGRRNEPAYVALVAEKLADLHHTPLDEVQMATWKNAEKLFHWGANL